MCSSQGFLLNIAPLGGHLGCVQIPNMVEVLLQSELVLVPAEGECMGEQLPITWSLLVTSHHLNGAGLSGMADNSGHKGPAPDILGWAGHLTGVAAALHRAWVGTWHCIVTALSLNTCYIHFMGFLIVTVTGGKCLK